MKSLSRLKLAYASKAGPRELDFLTNAKHDIHLIPEAEGYPALVAVVDKLTKQATFVNFQNVIYFELADSDSETKAVTKKAPAKQPRP